MYSQVPQATQRVHHSRFLVLQASGEAMYTSDIGVGSEQFFAATVTTTTAAARIEYVETSAAEKVRIPSMLI